MRDREGEREGEREREREGGGEGREKGECEKGRKGLVNHVVIYYLDICVTNLVTDGWTWNLSNFTLYTPPSLFYKLSE